MRQIWWLRVGWTGVALAVLVGAGCGSHELTFRGEDDDGVKLSKSAGSPVVEIHRDTRLSSTAVFPFRLKGHEVDCRGVAGPYKNQIPYPGNPNSKDHVKLKVVNSEPWLDLADGYGFAYLYRRYLMPRTRRIAGGMTGGTGAPTAPTYYTGGCVVSSDKANDYIFFFHLDSLGGGQSPSMHVAHAADATRFVDLAPGQFCVVDDTTVGPPQNIAGTADPKAIEILKAARQGAQAQNQPLPPNAP